DGGDLERATELSGQDLGIALENSDQGAADIAEPGVADPQWGAAVAIGVFLHGLENAAPGVAARLTALAEIEDEQGVTGDRAAEPGRGPAACGDEGLDGLTKGLDITHLLASRLSGQS